eukprot:GHRR01017696.1.p1 GENE.GHRR01017696.1~~GHRR01017696.1.p1  ORF type:complete len:867 (+),score=461.27 GHRR01017696.1:375-2975(+)
MNLAANAPAVAFGPEDLACPICVETIEDAFATPCGHTFCYKCISTHLKNRSNCPSCGAHLTQDRIHPNFLLSKLIKHVANSQLNLKTALLQHVQEDLAVAAGKIGLQELDTAIQLLQERRQHVLTHESSNKLQLLLLFLQHAKAKQQGKLSELEQQLTVLQQDLSRALQAQQQQQHHLQPQHQQQPRLELTGSNQVQQLEAAAKPSAIPNGFVVAAAGKSGVSDVSATGVHLQHQQLQQQPVTGANDAHSFGGTASAFRWLPAPIAQQPSVPQQHWQQQQAQQQLNNGSMQELGRAQGFKPFVAQQQLLQSQPQSQPHQQHQPQQENKQLGGFKPYRSFSAAATGLSTATAPLQVQPLQQMQQQQQLAFQQSGLQQHQQQLQQQHQQFAQQQQQQQGQPGYLPGDTNRVQGFTAFEPTPNAYGLNPSSPGLNPDKKRKILQQFDELQHAYMNSRIRKCLMGAGAGGVQQAKPESMAPIGQAGANGITSPGFMPVLGSGAVLQAVNGAVQQEDEGASSSLLHPTVTVNAVNAAPAPSPAAAVGTPAGLAVSGSGAVQPASIALKHEPGFGGVQPIAAAEIQPSNAAGAAGAANAAASSAAATPATQGGTAAEDNGEVIAGADGDQAAELDAFSDVLAGLTYYNSLAPVAHIPPSSSNSNGAAAAAARPGGGASILSSIEFDCAGQLFAAAGVQQRICVYDYQAVMAAQNSSNETPTSFSTAADSAALQPLLDLPTRYKISCVSFSAAVQQYMLSSDYEGLVHLWDLHGGKIVRQWEAHDKRIWAVDSCPLDPDVFATGSDDGTVRVWGLREPPMARLTLPVWANVCSIEFSPAVAHMLAVGNAGHQVGLELVLHKFSSIMACNPCSK